MVNKSNISLKGKQTVFKFYLQICTKLCAKLSILNIIHDFQMKSSVRLNKMKFYAFHGVMEQEKKVGNIFVVDLELFLDLSKASETDELSDTVNYAEIYEIVKNEIEMPSNLLEHIAGRILRKLKKEFPVIERIEICLAKERPPIAGEIESVAVVITYCHPPESL